jgi:hypothetical protein
VITVDAFLRDAGCYATTDVLHVAVTNAPAYAGIDFSSCPVLVYARPRGLSDAPKWEELLPRRTFSELPADYAIEDATNYNYLVYLDYVPPSPVHTNGVFELRGFMVPGDEPGNLEQLAAGFINSRAILPPPTARDYVQDGLIAMWDGIENAGWGTHDPNATEWKDLMGSLDATTIDSPIFGDNYTDTSNTDNSYTDPSIHPSYCPKVERAVIEADVREQIDYPRLAESYPYDDPESILELICDVLCSTADTIRIANENIPTPKVQERYRRLDFEHVTYVMDSIRETTTKIKNIRGYLLTAHYYAPITIGPYYAAAVRHDFG